MKCKAKRKMDTSYANPNVVNIREELQTALQIACHVRDELGTLYQTACSEPESNMDDLVVSVREVRACFVAASNALTAAALKRKEAKRAEEERAKAEKARQDEIAALKARLLELEEGVTPAPRKRLVVTCPPLPEPSVVAPIPTAVAVPVPVAAPAVPPSHTLSAAATLAAPAPMPPPPARKPAGRAGFGFKTASRSVAVCASAGPASKRAKTESTGRGGRGGRGGAVSRGRGGAVGRGGRGGRGGAKAPPVPPFTGGSGVAETPREEEAAMCEDTQVLHEDSTDDEGAGGKSAYEGDTQPPDWN